jgi:hypothetical protein
MYTEYYIPQWKYQLAEPGTCGLSEPNNMMYTCTKEGVACSPKNENSNIFSIFIHTFYFPDELIPLQHALKAEL